MGPKIDGEMLQNKPLQYHQESLLTRFYYKTPKYFGGGKTALSALILSVHDRKELKQIFNSAATSFIDIRF